MSETNLTEQESDVAQLAVRCDQLEAMIERVQELAFKAFTLLGEQNDARIADIEALGKMIEGNDAEAFNACLRLRQESDLTNERLEALLCEVFPGHAQLTRHINQALFPKLQKPSSGD